MQRSVGVVVLVFDVNVPLPVLEPRGLHDDRLVGLPVDALAVVAGGPLHRTEFALGVRNRLERIEHLHLRLKVDAPPLDALVHLKLEVSPRKRRRCGMTGSGDQQPDSAEKEKP